MAVIGHLEQIVSKNYFKRYHYPRMVPMDEQEKMRFINEVRRIVGETNEWADEHIESGKSLTPEAVEVVKGILLKLKELKQSLRDF